MFVQLYKAVCDDCGFIDYFASDKHLRAKGWALARNRLNCYCPFCAPRHRHVGRKKKFNSNSTIIKNG